MDGNALTTLRSISKHANDLDSRSTTDKWKDIGFIWSNFVADAKTYGKIIITERNVCKNDQQNNAPFQLNDKRNFIEISKKPTSIQYKFEVDEINPEKGEYLYGTDKPNDEGAMKTASNEILGLLSCFNSYVEVFGRINDNQSHEKEREIREILFPYRCILDYRGYRLLAMTNFIQLENNNYYCSDYTENFIEELNEIGKNLNLKESSIGKKGKKTRLPFVKIYALTSIENTDVIEYRIQNFSKVFPPEFLIENQTEKEREYQRFRPEFMCIYNETELASNPTTEEEINDLIKATKYLHENCINEFIKLKGSSDYSIHLLTAEIHRSGINCRHLGRIRNKLTNEKQKHTILSEIVARSLKSIFQYFQRKTAEKFKSEKFNSVDSAKIQPYVIIAYKIINCLFKDVEREERQDDQYQDENNHEKIIANINNKDILSCIEYLEINEDKFMENSNEIWKFKLKYFIQKKFHQTFTNDELNNFNFDIRKKINIFETCFRFCELSGIKFSKLISFYNYSQKKKNISINKFPFDKNDLKKIICRVHSISFSDFAQAKYSYLHYKKLLNDNSNCLTPNVNVWNSIHDKFNQTVSSETRNPNIFKTWATVYLNQHYFSFKSDNNNNNNINDKIQSSQEILQESKSKYEKAIEFLDKQKNKEIYYKCKIGIAFCRIELCVFYHIKTHEEKKTFLLSVSLYHLFQAIQIFQEIFIELSETEENIKKIILDNIMKKIQKIKNINHYHLQERKLVSYLRNFYLRYAILFSIKNYTQNDDENYDSDDNDRKFDWFCISNYKKSISSLIKYLKNGGNDKYSIITSSVGSLLESLFLRLKTLTNSNNEILYSLTNEFIEIGMKSQFSNMPVPILYKDMDKDNYSVTFVSSSCSLLHFFCIVSDEIAYDTWNEFIRVLGKSKTDPDADDIVSFKQPKSNYFILVNSTQDHFILNQIEIGVPITKPPPRLTLYAIGSMDDNLDFSNIDNNNILSNNIIVDETLHHGHNVLSVKGKKIGGKQSFFIFILYFSLNEIYIFSFN